MKIMVRGTNWLGDAVMTVPALRALRRVFPDAEITLYTRTETANLFLEADFVDSVIAFSPGRSSIKRFFDHIHSLRAGNYELAILLTNSWESALVAMLASIPTRIGYDHEHRGIVLTDAIPVPKWKADRHEVHFYLNLIGEIEEKYSGTRAISNEPPNAELMVSFPRQNDARGLLKRNGAGMNRPIVALGVGSTNSRAKRWPAISYALLADRLKAELEVDVLLIGSEGDRTAADEVMASSKSDLIDLTGKTSVADAAAILSTIDLLISNDMGLAHIAPSTGTPTIVIFGPTDPVTTRPFSNNAEVVRIPVGCSPCMLRDCPIDHRCMTNVSVDDILAKALNTLRLHER